MKLKLLKSNALGRRGDEIDQAKAGLSDRDVAQLLERKALVRLDAKGRAVGDDPTPAPPSGSPGGRAPKSSSSRAAHPPISSETIRRRRG